MDARGILAGFFIFLFASGISGYLTANAIATTATDPDFYSSALESLGVYDELYANVLPEAAGGLLGDEQLAQVKQELTLTRFKGIIDSTITQFIDYLTARSETIPVISIPSVLGLPPMEMSIDQYVPESSLLEMRQIIQQFFVILNILLAGAVVSLIIAIALGRAITDRVKLLGKALITGGVFSLISAMALLAVPAVLLSAMKSSLPEQAFDIVEPVVGEFISRIFMLVLFSAIILVLLGICAVIIAHILKKREMRMPAEPKPSPAPEGPKPAEPAQAKPIGQAVPAAKPKKEKISQPVFQIKGASAD